jgi:HSP20 family protein
MTRLMRRTNDMRNLQREIDQLFDSFFPTRSSDQDESSSAVWAPRVDLAESENAYHIHVDLPGMTRDDLKINYQDGQLTISGQRREELSEEKGEYVRVERTFGNFYRSFKLPKTVNADDITATYENGVLEIEVPKAEETKPRQIEIK